MSTVHPKKKLLMLPGPDQRLGQGHERDAKADDQPQVARVHHPPPEHHREGQVPLPDQRAHRHHHRLRDGRGRGGRLRTWCGPGTTWSSPSTGSSAQRLAEAIELAGGNAVKVIAEPGHGPAPRRGQGGDQEDGQPEGRLRGPQRDQHRAARSPTYRSWRRAAHEKDAFYVVDARLEPRRILRPGRRVGGRHLRHREPKVPRGAARARRYSP